MIIKIGTILFLAVLLFVPLTMIATMDFTGVVSENENKNLAKFPTAFVTSENFPAQMSAYIDDRIGFRYELINAGTLFPFLQTNALNLNDTTLLGLDGWLYYNYNETGETSRDFQRLDKYSSDQIAVFRKAFQEVDEWCEEYGAKLIIMIIPNKHNVYPENYPPVFRRLEGNSRYEQIIALNDIAEVIDLGATLMAAKGNSEVFYKQDTHWNLAGAHAAYEELITTMSKFNHGAGLLRAISQDHIEFIDKGKKKGDLFNATRFALKNTDTLYVPKFSDNISITNKHKQMLPDKRTFYTSRSSVKNDIKVFVVHDSFFLDIIDFIERSVSQITTRWEWGVSPLKYADLIIAEKPDFVIWEMHERYLFKILDGSYASPEAFLQNTENAKDITE